MPQDKAGFYYAADESYADLTVASAAVTADANVDADILGPSVIFVEYDITAVTGTGPTLDVTIQASPDGGTTWYDVHTFAQATAVSTLRAAAPVAGDKVRIKQDVGGTAPSFTRTITTSYQRVS